MAKMGRPKSVNPKKNRIGTRFTDEEMALLEQYARKHNLTIAQSIREGVKLLVSSGV